MLLANIIFAMFLLFAWLNGAASMRAMAVWPSVPSQESNNSPAQHSSPQAPADQPTTSDQTATPTQPPPPGDFPCPQKQQAGSGPDCKPATRTRKHRRNHKTVTPAETPGTTGPAKTVVRNGSTTETTVDLSPGLSEQQASQQKDSTHQLLANSDANLKKVSDRALSASQQDTVKQIKSFAEQASQAEKEGDLPRAHSLALKANLLSAELVGH